VNIQSFDNDPAPKRFHVGTHRLTDPSQTLQRVTPFMSAMGITRVGNITGLDRIGIPVAIAVRPNSRSLAVAQGKGTSLDAAKASALMEAIETYHAENIVHSLRYGTYADLRQV
jgi:YcaO-like protein with predicted kinase domain